MPQYLLSVLQEEGAEPPSPELVRRSRRQASTDQAYRRRTNGKAERFIQTMLREWAYAAVYQSSTHRAQALGPWLAYYNHQRPHSALGHKPPCRRLETAQA